jgi:hypothetical protein
MENKTHKSYKLPHFPPSTRTDRHPDPRSLHHHPLTERLVRSCYYLSVCSCTPHIPIPPTCSYQASQRKRRSRRTSTTLNNNNNNININPGLFSHFPSFLSSHLCLACLLCLFLEPSLEGCRSSCLLISPSIPSPRQRRFLLFFSALGWT